jgi:predicted nucleotidyltransferase
MTRAEIITALRNQAPDIRTFGATSLYLFGSAARGGGKGR